MPRLIYLYYIYVARMNHTDDVCCVCVFCVCKYTLVFIVIYGPCAMICATHTHIHVILVLASFQSAYYMIIIIMIIVERVFFVLFV